MADSGDLGFSFGVSDEASEPLGAVEQAYIGLMSTMDTFHKKLATSMGAYSDRTEEAAEAAERGAEEEVKKTSKLEQAREALRENAFSLEELGISWDKFLAGLTAITVGAAIAALVGFFQKALEAAMKFRQEIAELNEVYTLNRRQTSEVASAVLGLADRAGRTREEVGSMVRELLELGQVPGEVDKLGISFKELAAATLDLSAATGTGMESSAEFVDELIRFNQVPANRIRSIGFSIKNVADSTRIAADELLGFNKGLQPLFAFMTDKSGEARAEFTQNMMGIAGVLSDVGIDANKATGSFAEMLDRTSEEGAKSLGQLAQFTNLGTEQLREMIQNDPSEVFEQLARSAARMSPDQLQLMSRSLEPLGLNFSELTRLADEFGREGSRSFKQAVKDAVKFDAKDDALQRAAMRRQERISGIIKRFERMWETVMIAIGGALADEVIGPLMDDLFPLIKDIAAWIRGVDWKAVFGGMADAIKFIWSLFDILVLQWFRNLETVRAGIDKFFTTDLPEINASVEEAIQTTYQRVSDFIADSIKEFELSLIQSFDLVIEGFERFIDNIKDYAPDLETFAGVLFGNATVFKAIKGLLEESAPATDPTVREALGAAPQVTVGSPTAAIPGRLETRSPGVEQLLREQVAETRALRNEMKGKRRASGASAVRESMVRYNAGETG